MPHSRPITVVYGVKISDNMKEFSDFLGLPFVAMGDLEGGDFSERMDDVCVAILKYDFGPYLLADVGEFSMAVLDGYTTLILGIRMDVVDSAINSEQLSLAQEMLNERKQRIVNPVLCEIFDKHEAMAHLILTDELIHE